jgi:mono/diheme cytochrome c family protein
MDPCPQLKWHAGIWRFDANKQNQTQQNAYRYATGLRSIVAMDWNKEDNTLYAVQHGRDNLHRNWPQIYTPWESALLPAEEFFRVKQGTDGGWPYYYFDQLQGKKLLNPEYGGDGKKQGNAKQVERPLLGFPGHFAPNDLHFYRGEQFPDRYKNGAFIAFHGSTIRAPYPQGGYFVAFVPFENGEPSESWEVFADGFAALEPIINTRDAAARPMGIAMGPDGSLYISDSVQGKIWRIMFKGDKQNFREAALAKMEERKRTAANIKTPHEEKDNLEKDMIEAGARVYNLYCAPCHQRDGRGDGARFPPLGKSEWVVGNKKRLIELLLNGMEKPITVNGEAYEGTMPSHGFLSDEDASAVLTYIRKSFGNQASSISIADVEEARSKIGTNDRSKGEK